MERLGVIIVDASRRVRLMTPAAEELLGWTSDQVVGEPCSAVFDCHDPEGGSLCGRCGIGASFKRQEVIPPEPVDVALSDGGRRRMRMSFWYLPPEGRIYEPRVMAVLQRSAEGEIA